MQAEQIQEPWRYQSLRSGGDKLQSSFVSYNLPQEQYRYMHTWVAGYVACNIHLCTYARAHVRMILKHSMIATKSL